MKKLLFIAIAAIAFTGCVSKKQYTALQTDYMRQSSALNDAQVALAACEANSKNLTERLNDAKDANDKLQAALTSAMANTSASSVNISRLVDQIEASNKYIKQLTDAKAKSDSLNIVLTNNLTRSLSKEELKDVDVKVLKGVVYISLNDNMLYTSGSWKISNAAGETLSKIAKIIQDHKDYDVLIEGNTDSNPISTTNIRNNWDLSCLRAASVVMELQNRYGIDPKRLTAGGRGEYNPLATNDTAEGRAQNRRTQIIITPQLDQFLDLIDKAPEEDQK
ncbi:MAG: OmpA family protein [Bacteroidaceae bacterium]|nr:OmpA family protein [Bacteroidaceae bacterium]